MIKTNRMKRKKKKKKESVSSACVFAWFTPTHKTKGGIPDENIRRNSVFVPWGSNHRQHVASKKLPSSLS